MQTIHGQVVSEIIESCRAHGFTDVILVHEHRGIPDGFIISHLPFGPTAYFGFLNVASILQRCFHVKLGTMEQSEALIEWIIRPYMTTTKKRSFIGNDPEPDDKRKK
ncbi:hypothetical protein GOBAR_DD22226 [Gossypium barbadense]|nr:hypothetical protein GOBAR_DD22226 [Gossypium barbadense]